MVVNIVENLVKLGFTTYEARAYVALLDSHPATAYEAAKLSGLPTSKIYQVLSRLQEKGMVMEMVEKGRRQFVPLEAGEFVESFRSRVDTTLGELEREHCKLIERGPARVSPFCVPKLMVNAASANVSIYFKFRGSNTAVVTACASGAHAIGDALAQIRNGNADIMIAGGCEAALTRLGLARCIGSSGGV